VPSRAAPGKLTSKEWVFKEVIAPAIGARNKSAAKAKLLYPSMHLEFFRNQKKPKAKFLLEAADANRYHSSVQ
jgi:hypothetical protein